MIYSIMKKSFKKNFDKTQYIKINKIYKNEFAKLCNENSNESKAVKKHTVKNMYPVISAYKSLQIYGYNKEKAYKYVSDTYYKYVEKSASIMRYLLKIPYVYKQLPFMWKKITVTKFGEKAGFKFHFYDVGKKRVKFDMLKCPYCDILEKNNCRELVTIFCHSDDITNENVHPKVLWNRTKTMGSGSDCCDFDVIIKD